MDFPDYDEFVLIDECFFCDGITHLSFNLQDDVIVHHGHKQAYYLLTVYCPFEVTVSESQKAMLKSVRMAKEGKCLSRW